MWEETEIRSAPRVLAEKGTFRKPCTASVWKMASGQILWVSLAMAEMGIPNWVTVKLDAKVSEVPEGAELPACFKVDEKDTVRFTKPRGAKE